MEKQKAKKGPARKEPKRRHAEAKALEEPQYRPRIVRKVRKYDERYEDSYHRLDDD